MRKLMVGVLLMLAFVVAASAQSGRRSKIPTAKPASPEVSAAESKQRSDDPSAYSESAPNTARSIWARPEKSKKSKEKTTEPAQPAAPTAAPASAAGEEEVIKVDTALVTVPVSVYDRNGLYIANLRQSDFKIFEDGSEQEIAYFGTSEKPITVVLLIDVSNSTTYKIEEIQQAAITFVDQLKPTDNVMVIQFDDSVDVLTELTTDREKINRAIRRTGFGGGTALYDAVDFTLRKRLDKVEGRKAIVLFTDGVDTTSRTSLERTLRNAEESDALVFPIYYNTFLSSIGIGGGGVMTTPPILGLPGSGGQRPPGTRSEDYTRGRAYLNELASITGGRLFRAESTPGGLSAAFEGIAKELSMQYNIGYFPQAEGETGQRKQIKVRVYRPNVIVRSRDSYIVGSNTATASTQTK